MHAWALYDRIPASAAARERSAASDNQRLRFTDGRGIDVRGQPVDVNRLPGTKRVVAFLLRVGSLEEDMRFWSEVAQLLPQTSGVRLLAYCDGVECVRRVAASTQPGMFPTIAYGEVVGSQAVFNADAKGAFVASDAHDDAVTSWRDSIQRPAEIAGRLLQ